MRVFTDPTSGYTRCDMWEHSPLSLEGLVPSGSQWFIYFNSPEKCEEGQTYLRTHLPKYPNKVIGGYKGLDITVLRFEHSFAIGVVVTMVGVISLCVSLFWAIIKGDISGGFSVGGYILTLTTLIAALWVRYA
jgi:hypothetical protein